MVKPKISRRKPIDLRADLPIQTRSLHPNSPLPLAVEPAIEGLNLTGWATRNRTWIETQLLQHGGILFRGFKIQNAMDFEQFVSALSDELMPYAYRSTPRRPVRGNVYTSTEYPAAQLIPLHNELSYSRHWPMKIWFCCLQKASKGGQTPIADSRGILNHLNPELVEKFQRKGVRYVRNYNRQLDLPWQDVFQTDKKSDVEAYCQRAGIEYEWFDGDRLRTWQTCQAIATHPQTGDRVWFNQAHLFHLSSLTEDARDALLSVVDLDNLPRHAYYGDGSEIEPEVLTEIRQAYDREILAFDWQPGDILMLDNMLVAHGRTPFSGSRQVVVGMADPYRSEKE